LESQPIPTTELAQLDTNKIAATNLSDDKQAAQSNHMLMLGVAVIFLYQVFLLILAGWQNRHALTPDGVSYIRIASYYLHGQFDLAVSGYWGPMLSWLIAPWLALVENPLYAARITMGFSAIVFLIGCVSIFRSLEIHPAGLVLGAWVAAVSSAAWSVETIAADLLMSGLMCLAISRMITSHWLESRSLQIAAGVFWGMAYLAKAVAFPLAFIISGAIALLWLIGRWSDRKVIGRSLTITLSAFLSVACVWVLMLSLKYERVVFSTNGTINYANAGPTNTTRRHPSFVIFHQPEAGRVTSWEDPTDMPYQSWSPFDSLENFKHQLILISWNAELAFKHLSEFATPQFGLFAMILGLLVHTPWRENMKTQRWRWAGVIVACIVGIYLPVYGEEQRHYYATFPLLFAASIGMMTWLTREYRGIVAWHRLIGFTIVAICFAVPGYTALKRASIQTAEKKEVSYARELANKLQSANVHGSIVGGREAGLFTALVAERAWYGDKMNPTIDELKNSGADLVILPRYETEIEQSNQGQTFVNIDSLLFNGEENTKKFPLKVYHITHP